MRYLSLLVLMAFSSVVYSQQPKTNLFAVDIVYPTDKVVSPGGYIGIKIYSISSLVSPGGNISVQLTTDSNELIDKWYPSNSLYWHYIQNSTYPRYIKIKIKDDIGDIALPKIINIKPASPTGVQFASVSFYVREGSFGNNIYNIPADKFHSQVVVDDDHKENAWYELYCISSKTSSCAIDIKNSNHDKYNGEPVKHAQNTCSDSGFPTRTIDVRSSVIFDFRKLITDNDPHTNLPHGYTNQDNAVCNIISTGRFVLRPVNYQYISNPEK